jgi:hypothetical protein
VLWGTPAYHHVQSAFQSTPTGSQWYGSGFQPASPHLPISTLAVSPANYIAAGLHASQDSQSQASSVTSVRTLSSDALGNPFRDLRTHSGGIPTGRAGTSLCQLWSSLAIHPGRPADGNATVHGAQPTGHRPEHQAP